MRAVSVRQPWAWAIARGHQPVLNRAADTGYRGPVAIYASFRVDLESFESDVVRQAASAAWDPADPAAAIGGIVAVVSLAGVCAAAASGAPCGCGEWARSGRLSLAARGSAAAAVAGPGRGPARPVGADPGGRRRRGPAAG